MKQLTPRNSVKTALLTTALVTALTIPASAFILEIKCSEDISLTLSDNKASVKAGRIHLLQRRNIQFSMAANKYQLLDKSGDNTALNNGSFVAYISKKNQQQFENVIVIKAYTDKLVNDNAGESHFKKSYPGQKVKMGRNYLYNNLKSCEKKSARFAHWASLPGMFQMKYPLSNYVAHHRSTVTNLDTQISNNHFYYRRSQTNTGYKCVSTDSFTTKIDRRSAYRLDNRKSTFGGRFIAGINNAASALRSQAQTNNRVVAQVLHHRFSPNYNKPTCIHFSLSNSKQIISLTIKDLESNLGFQWKRN